MNKKEFIETLMDMGFCGAKQGTWERGWDAAISDVIAIAEELDEPETLSEEWIENHTASADTISYYSEENVPVVTVSNLKGLLVPNQDKPVIPQFVVDWIERQKQPDWDYDKKEDALADSIHFTLYSLEANYPETNHDVVLRKPVNEWLNDDRKNYWKLIDGVRYGYEVETEKLYRVRAGNRYVRFNLDGSIIGAKKDNSIVCLERLSKLPFDYKKAVESGIITLEEVTE